MITMDRLETQEVLELQNFPERVIADAVSALPSCHPYSSTNDLEITGGDRDDRFCKVLNYGS